MKVGFIGLGNMGSAIAVGLLDNGGLEPGQVQLANRSPGKAEDLCLRFPGAEVVKENGRLAEQCDIVFVSVRADQVLDVLKEISSQRQGSHLVITNGGFTLDQMEKICPGAVSKLIPSITMEVGRGVSLVCYGSRVTSEQRDILENMLRKASMVKIVSEEQFEVTTDITSCGPALIAEMMGQFSSAGVRHGQIIPEEAWGMVLETLVGVALTLQNGIGVEELKSKVATKGGITEQGLKVLERELPGVFDQMIEATLTKYSMVRKSMAEQFDD